ncbi:unnamed protein product [Caenorhabditis sp. 36 PRJEB53466]|nr:unnamed protein product [Caenorhabditis sp. 36 PRJEB53466]
MKYRLLTNVLLVLTTWNLASSFPISDSAELANQSYRLPTSISPIHYDLEIKTFLPGYGWNSDAEKNLTFSGTVVITADVNDITDRIVLNSDSLNISSAQVVSENSNVKVSSVEVIKESQFVILHLSDSIEPQEGIAIRLDFEGKLRNDNKGYYITRSTKTDGDAIFNVVTQFETTDARYMIPCFDEPEFKATWQVTLIYPSNSTALTNTIEQETTQLSDEWVMTEYKKTVKMSSYLLAVFIGDVAYKEAITDKGLRIRVYTSPNKVNQIDHALEVSKITVEGFEKQFGIDFPMEKIDFVSAQQFAAGAMENWGLIVHKNPYLVGNNSQITTTVIHELAHQWFGNLVTMEFWDQVWLNEAFATYMTAWGFTYLFPGFDRNFWITNSQQKRAFYVDNTVALTDLSRASNGVIEILSINYTKGSSFVRMIEELIGVDAFNKAIRYYLRKNKYDNADASDLFAAFQTFMPFNLTGPDGKPLQLEEFAECWTLQNGHPTIYVEQIDDGKVVLTQKMNVEIARGFEDRNTCGYKWDVPIWYQEGGSDEVKLTWLARNEHSIELDAAFPVIINADSNGFYQVVYDKTLYGQIADQLTACNKNYSDSTKFRLLHDSGHFAGQRKVEFGSYIDIARALINDTNPIIRQEAIVSLWNFYDWLSSQVEVDKKGVDLAKDAIPEQDETRGFFDDCGPNDDFFKCFEIKGIENNIMYTCNVLKTDKHLPEVRILEWLKQEKDTDIRLPLIQFLGCANVETLKSIRGDQTYNWTDEDTKTYEQFTNPESQATMNGNLRSQEKDSMGHPPPKDEKKRCEVRAIALPTFCTLLGIVITAFITWHIARSIYAPKNKYDAPEAKHVETGPSAADLRLPTSVEPISYELAIKTYLPGFEYKAADNKSLTFEGQVTIELNITQSIRKITLNSVDLTYNDTICTLNVDGKEIPIRVEPHPDFEKVFFHLNSAVGPTSNATLKIGYSGRLRTDMTGLYQTTYTNSKGEKKMAAVTQMEPIYARRMVPCFDEPAFKATWKVTVIHPKGTKAVANGIEEEPTQIQDDFISSSFKTTPRMSSYLLAIFISEFEYNEAMTKSGVRFRVWSRPEEKNSTLYAVTAGVKCLEFYEKYYNVSFPLEKQDMVALPDFSAGAMENWGLITYRENSLLYDPRIYPGGQKRRVAVVIAHELAHQWFGNLVTLKWWNDLWLNEGFATLVEYLGTDEISDKNFKMEEWFRMDALWIALDADSVASSHPMTFQIDKAIEVMDSFDSVTYDKGGSVLAMIRKTIGEQVFNEGINHYLRLHQYENAQASDLFSALAEKMPDSVLGPDGKKLNVTAFADPWTKQMGYPLLKATRLNDTAIQVEQERFKVLKSAKEEEKYSHPKWGFKWDVPVWYQVVGSKNITMKWMQMNEPLIIHSDKPIILNAESHGFYRAGYTDDMWNEIIDLVLEDHTQFSPLTRIRLIDDAFAEAIAGVLNYSIPLRLITYLTKESDYIPWAATRTKFGVLVDMYGTDPEKDIVQDFLMSLGAKTPAKRSIEFVSKNYLDDTKFFEVLGAQGIIANDCEMGDSQCSTNMAKMFNEEVIGKCDKDRILSECSQISAPFRADAYCQAVRNGDEQIFDKVFHWYKNERNQVEKGNLMGALACSKDILTLKKLLLDAMNPNNSSFRLQDCGSLFQKVCGNDAAADSMLSFMIDRWADLKERLGKDRSGFHRILMSIVGTIKNQQGLDQLREFQQSDGYLNTKKADEDYGFRKMEESAEVTIAWRQINLKFVTQKAAELAKKI